MRGPLLRSTGMLAAGATDPWASRRPGQHEAATEERGPGVPTLPGLSWMRHVRDPRLSGFVLWALVWETVTCTQGTARVHKSDQNDSRNLSWWDPYQNHLARLAVCYTGRI